MATNIVSHYLAPWFLPPGLHILIASLGIALYRLWPTTSKILIIVSIISLWLASAPIVAYSLIESLQNRYPSLQHTPLIQPFSHAAIVVLGGGSDVSVERNRRVVSEITFSRLRYAAYLHKTIHLPLIVSGGKASIASDSEADLMLQTLQNDFHIPFALKEDKSFTTADESKLLAPILKQHHFDGVYLVTNAWHMPRSVESFTRAKIALIPAPMGYQVYDHHYTLLSYLPNIHALEASTIAMHEYIGLVWYRINNL